MANKYVKEIKELSLKEILYMISVMGEVNYLKDLYRNPFVKDIITHVNKRSRCKRSVLANFLEEYTLSYFVYEESEFVEERYLNSIRKYLGRRGQQVKFEDEDSE